MADPVCRESVAELHHKGHSATTIANILGINPRSVTRVRKELGLSHTNTKNADRLTRTEKKNIQDMLNDGMSYKEISRTTGRYESTISRHFPNQGWKPQQGGQQGVLNRRLGAVLA